MKLSASFILAILAGGMSTAFAQVDVSTPVDGASIGSTAAFAATAQPNGCASGVAAMGIYIDDGLVYTASGSSLNAVLPLGNGKHRAVLQSWDYCGGFSKTLIHINVDSTTQNNTGGTTLYNVQSAEGWNQWGELAPAYNICNPCDGISWSMVPHTTSVSLSGDATQFNTWGSTPYADVLWSYPFLGDGAPGRLKDHNHKLLPTLYNFQLDMQVFPTNMAVTQDLEFDINMFMDGVGMEWGTECNHLGDGVWDIWDNVNAKWLPTNIPCALNENSWNHVVLQVQRQPNNDLLYQAITVNGLVSEINRTVAPFPVAAGWWGMNVNFQMDGDKHQSQNTVYVDQMNVSYW